MAVSRMLKVEIIAHASIKEEVKAFLREAGAIEVTDVSTEGFHGAMNEGEAGNLSRLLDKAETAVQFLEPYVPRQSFVRRLGAVPPQVSPAEVEKTLREIDVEEIARRCAEFEGTIRRSNDELAWSRNLVKELEPWRAFASPLESLATGRYGVQFWRFPEKIFDTAVRSAYEKHPFIQHDVIARSAGTVYAALIVPRDEGDAVNDTLKTAGAVRSAFDNLAGAPAAIIEREKGTWNKLEARLAKVEEDSRALAAVRPRLCLLADYFRERLGLVEVERHFLFTEQTFVLEGWMRATDRRRLEKDLAARWSDVEITTRPPIEGEDPPIHLDNRRGAQPFEFIMTLYGRPLYGEVDPTPLLAPFFVLCFAMCMGDAGYGLALLALSGLLLFKLKVQGGMRSLMQILFAASILTIVVGVLTGGYFGIAVDSLPSSFRRLILLDPLSDPMTMLNVAFLIGIVHILFGMGVKMAVNMRAGLWGDAIFDDLLWILFLIVLVPLGYRGILGGAVPPAVMHVCSRAALGIAAVLFLSGIRKEKNKFLGVFKSLLKFYGLTSYFGDVLSYARLLALGLATSAIALAINGIAQMVSGLPYHTGAVAMVLVLIGGHAFNFLVNILGAFVHSARLQYLEFFNKFFTGGGREFRPFRNERRYTILKQTENRA